MPNQRASRFAESGLASLQVSLNFLASSRADAYLSRKLEM
jgi:hypothetical protein